MPGWADVAPQRFNGTTWDTPETGRRVTGGWVTPAIQVYRDIPADTAGPIIGITSPAAASTISGPVLLTGTVVDSAGVGSLVLRVGSVVVGSPTIVGTDWSLTIDTLALPNGNVTVTLEATDTIGNGSTVSRAYLVNNVSTNPDVVGAYVQPTYTQSSTATVTGAVIFPDDPRLTYEGVDGPLILATTGTTTGFYRPPYIVGTTNTIPTFAPKFNCSAQVVEIWYYTHTNGEEIRVSVNGKWQTQTTTAPYRSTAGSGTPTFLRLDFGSAALRTIRIGMRTWFGGIRVVSDGAITKAADPTFEVVHLGDSLSGGTLKGNGNDSTYYTALSSYLLQTAQTLGWQHVYNEGIGGSGFTVNGDGGGAGRYIDRVPAAVNARNPNVVILGARVLNDQGAGRTPTQCRDALITVLTSMRNALPNANIICELTPLAPAIVATAGSVNAGVALIKTYSDPMRVAAAQFGAFVVDPLDGNVYGSDGQLLGNPAGGRWQMPTDASGVPGTGYPSDYMTSDGVHPTRAGSFVLAGQTSAALQMIVASAGWFGPDGEADAPADTSPPVPPTLSTPAVTSTSVTLTWSAATDPSGISGYRVYRSGALAASVTGTTWTQSGLTANTTYGPYEVTAVDNSAAQNESSRSNQQTAKTDVANADVTAPTVPGSLVVNPTNGGFTATWTGSTDAGSGMAGYRVYVAGSLRQSVLLTNYTATGLTNGQTVGVQVSAYDNAGNESAKTAAVNVTPAVSTTAPDAPTALAVVAGDSTLRITWAPPASGTPKGYYVYIGGVRVHEERAVTQTVIDELVNGTNYSVRVSAYDVNGNESSLSPAVSDTPYPASALGAPIEVRSFGPNGTHWPDRTPWLYGPVAKTVAVACTWAAIKAAVNALTAAEVNAGVKITVAPGVLPGGGGSAGSAPMLLLAGQKSWRKRVLIVPRDGRGTVTFSNSVVIKQCYNICLAMFDMDQSMGMTWVGCSYSAMAWCVMKSSRITGLGDTDNNGLASGECMDGFDCVEVAWRFYITGDLDPMQLSGGTPGTAGAAGGNGWHRFARVIGCYIAPQIRPIGGIGHNDGLQLQSGGSLYYGFTVKDTATWASSNSAMQFGKWSQDGAPGNPWDEWAGPIRYHTRRDHCLDIAAKPLGQLRYPWDPATQEEPNASAVYNDTGRSPQHYAKDTVAVGGMYSKYLKWSTVTNSRKADTGVVSVISGSWALDTAMLSWPKATLDRINPVPDENRLNLIWSSTPPPQAPPVLPAIGDSTGGGGGVSEASYTNTYSTTY